MQENENFALSPAGLQRVQALRELRECNDYTSRYGLSLTEQQMLTLVEKRFESLREAGRVEFGQGVLQKLIYAFCDSPYISAENYEDALLELQDSFYYFKNECLDLLSDDGLIDYMKRHFDSECQGSLEYLSGTTLEELCRDIRSGEGDDREPYSRRF